MESQSQNEGVPDRQGSLKPRDPVEGGLLYIGMPAVTLYPLGFVALGIQLWRDPSFPYHDFSTIWEAVSLIPEIVVVATGIRLIYTSLIATIFGAAVVRLLMTLLLWRLDKAGEGDRPPHRFSRSRHPWSVLLLLLLPLAAASILIWGDMPIDARPDNDSAYVAGFAVFALVGGRIINLVRSRSRDDWFVLGMATAYLSHSHSRRLVSRRHTDTGPVAGQGRRARDRGQRRRDLLGGYPRRHVRKAGEGPVLMASL